MAKDFNEIADPITEVGTALQVMLCREGLDWNEKPSRFEGSESADEEGEDEEDDDEEEEDDLSQLSKKRTKSKG